VPGEEEPPTITSGARIGTPALTTRGMGSEQIERVGALISRVLSNPDDERAKGEVADEVSTLCDEFPLYPDLQ
jgi:glycine hydroxymethyltransferase